MSENISLKDAERRVFMAATQDGLWDIFIGSVLMIFAIAPFLSAGLGDFWSSAVFLPFWGLVALAITLVRKRVLAPRIGTVEFGPRRKTRLKRFSLVLLLLNLFAFLLGVIAAANFVDNAGLLFAGTFGLIVLVGFSAAAYLLEIRRLFAYGLLVALSPLVGEWLYISWGVPHHGFPLTFGVTSGLIILVGLFLFVRLLRANPVPAADTPAAEV